MVKESTCKII